MIKASDGSIAVAAFLSSDRFLLTECVDEKEELARAILDYQPYLQRKLRTDDVKAIVEQMYDSHSFCFNSFLTNLNLEYLQWNGERFIVKPEKLSEWLELLSLIDGTWIIAQGYADLCKQHQFGAQELSNCIEKNQCPFALPLDQIGNQFADNHVHLGGHGYLGPSLLSFCLYGNTINQEFTWPTRSEYSLYESGYLSKASLVNEVGILADDTASRLFYSDKSMDSVDSVHIFQGKTLDAIDQFPDISEAQKFISRSSCLSQSSVKRWLLYTTGLLTDNSANISLIKLIRLCNILRNYMIVSGVGLSQFVEVSRFGMRRSRSEQQNKEQIDNFEADIDNRTFREFRVVPKFVLGNKKNKPVNPKYFEKALKYIFERTLAENTHFVIHFTRSGNRQDKLQEDFRTQIKNQVEYLQDFSSSVTFSEKELASSQLLNKVINTSLDLRKAIRGYDVAGNENELPIEVFAPALRRLRDSKIPTKGLMSNRLSKPFITVHAGEDFSHLLSGMRSIDESVVFCDFQVGDRIGHALALGVCPISWAQRQQTAYLTVGEHLDNLVWSHQKALTVIQSVPNLVGVLHLLQEKIHYWSEFLYGEAQPPKRLYDAWLLRRNCPLVLNINQRDIFNAPVINPNDPLYSGWVLDFYDKNDAYVQAKHINLWQTYLLAELDKNFKKRRDKIVKIDCIGKCSSDTFGYENGSYFDSVSLPELDLYEAIQDWSMEYYAAKGIIIEACPTSNIYIGRFEHYHEHPIFRWDPPEQEWLKQGEKYNRFGLRKGSVTVCINTDDAALMPTTIQNEHRVLQKAAVEHFNVGVNKAEDWIERVRRKGVEIFKANHLDWVNK